MNTPDELPEDDLPQRPSDLEHEQVQVAGITARVPPSVGRGCFSTGVIVMTGQHTFVLDFLQQMGVPSHLVSRVVLPHAVMPRFIEALQQNLNMYTQKFGAPPELPKPPAGQRRPSVQEIYENLKLPDEELPGRFADGVVIRHSAAEFCFDFVTHFFPHASLAQRVFLSAPHVPPLLAAMTGNYQKFLEGRPPEPPPPQ